LRVVPYS